MCKEKSMFESSEIHLFDRKPFQHRWCSGSIAAFQAVDMGSIPVRCIIQTTGKRVFNFREILNITIVCKKGTKYSRKSKVVSLFEFPNPWDVTNQKRQLSINEKRISMVSEKSTPLPKELFLVFSWCDTRKMCKEKSMFDSSEIDLFDR